MSSQFCVETSACAEHRVLLEECERALENWNDYRAEFCQVRFIRREAGDELVRLQAKCIRAYTALRNHETNCLLCKMTSRTGGCKPESSLDASSYYETCT